MLQLPESLVNQIEIPVDLLALTMSLKSMKILANMAHLQYHPRYCYIKATPQVWWIKIRSL